MNRRKLLGVLAFFGISTKLFSKEKLNEDLSIQNGASGIEPAISFIDKQAKSKSFKEPLNESIEDIEYLSYLCERTPVEETKWKEIVDKINNELKLTADNTILSKFEPELCSVVCKVNSSAFSRPSENFSKFHVEELLIQGEQLLLRALETKLKYDDLSIKYFNLLTSVKRYIDLDRINEQEIKAKFFDFEFEKTSKKIKSLKENLSGLEKLINIEADISTTLSTQKNNYILNKKRVAFFGALPWSDTEAKKPPYKRDFSTYTEENHKATHINQATSINSIRDYEIREKKVSVEKLSYEVSAEVNKTRIEAHEFIKSYEDKKRIFQIEKYCTKRRLNDIKAKAIVAKDGVLNYKSQLKSLSESFKRDYEEALSRIVSANEGLNVVFNHSDNFDLSRDDLFEFSLSYIRKKVIFLSKLKQKSQRVIIPISLAELLKNGFENQKLSGILKFTLDSNDILFKNMSFVRLNGVSCYINHETKKKENTKWQVIVTAPNLAVFKYAGGSSKTYKQESIDKVLCGRVSLLDNNWNGDVSGVKALLNSSPFGDWQMEILRNTFGVKNRDISDIIIEFHLSYIPLT